MITTRDLTILAIGALVCYLGLSIAADWMVPPCTDGQPDAHWQAEFNKLDHDWKMFGFCLESKPLAECKKEWGK